MHSAWSIKRSPSLAVSSMHHGLLQENKDNIEGEMLGIALISLAVVLKIDGKEINSYEYSFYSFAFCHTRVGA